MSWAMAWRITVFMRSLWPILLLAVTWAVGPALGPLLNGQLLGHGLTDLYPSVWGLWAFAASVLSAGAHIALRGLKLDPAGAVVFWFQVGICLLSGVSVLALQGGITLPPAHLWWAVGAVGGIATVGQLLMTWAYKLESAGRVAAVRFIGPLWGILGDVIFFSGWPEPHVWLGGTIVVGAGLTVVLQTLPAEEE